MLMLPHSEHVRALNENENKQLKILQMGYKWLKVCGCEFFTTFLYSNACTGTCTDDAMQPYRTMSTCSLSL